MGERYSEFYKQVGASLQRIRKAAGFKSARSFAEHIKMNPQTYTDYEQGKSMFSYERAWTIADALNCSLDELGGRKALKSYEDPGQQRLNNCYENMNDSGQQTLVSVAQGLEKDPANRIIKDGQEHLANQQSA